MEFGFEKDKEGITYNTHLDNYVRIITSNGNNFIGKMASTDYDYTVLNPSFIDLRCFNKVECEISEENTVINTKGILAVEPITKNHLDDIVKQYKTENKRLQKKEKKKWVKEETTSNTQ